MVSREAVPGRVELRLEGAGRGERLGLSRERHDHVAGDVVDEIAEARVVLGGRVLPVAGVQHRSGAVEDPVDRPVTGALDLDPVELVRVGDPFPAVAALPLDLPGQARHLDQPRRRRRDPDTLPVLRRERDLVRGVAGVVALADTRQSRRAVLRRSDLDPRGPGRLRLAEERPLHRPVLRPHELDPVELLAVRAPLPAAGAVPLDLARQAGKVHADLAGRLDLLVPDRALERDDVLGVAGVLRIADLRLRHGGRGKRHEGSGYSGDGDPCGGPLRARAGVPHRFSSSVRGCSVGSRRENRSGWPWRVRDTGIFLGFRELAPGEPGQQPGDAGGREQPGAGERPSQGLFRALLPGPPAGAPRRRRGRSREACRPSSPRGTERSEPT